MATLLEILSNKEIGDDQAISLGGVEFKVRDLREMVSGVDREKQAAQSRMTQAEQTRAKAEELAQQAAELIAQLQSQPPPRAAEATAPDWTADVILQPLVPVLKPLLEKTSQYEKALENMQKMIAQVQGIYALRELERQWQSYEPKMKDKNLNFEQVVQRVLQQKAVDKYGVPTMEPIMKEIFAPDREAEIRAEERAKAEAEWKGRVDAASKAASMPKPGAAFRPSTRGEKPPIAKIQDLTAEAIAGDDTIAKLVAGVQ